MGTTTRAVVSCSPYTTTVMAPTTGDRRPPVQSGGSAAALVSVASAAYSARIRASGIVQLEAWRQKATHRNGGIVVKVPVRERRIVAQGRR